MVKKEELIKSLKFNDLIVSEKVVEALESIFDKSESFQNYFLTKVYEDKFDEIHNFNESMECFKLVNEFAMKYVGISIYENKYFHLRELTPNFIYYLDEFFAIEKRIPKSSSKTFHRVLEQLLKSAKKKGIISENPYSSLKVKALYFDKNIPMTRENLERFQNLELKNKKMKSTQILYMMSVYTKFHVQSLYFLQYSQFDFRKSNYGCIKKHCVFTEGTELIDIPIYSKKIIKSFFEERENLDFEISHRVFEKNLEKICKKLNIDQKLNWVTAYNTHKMLMNSQKLEFNLTTSQNKL